MSPEVWISLIGTIVALAIIMIGLLKGLPALIITPIASVVLILIAGLNFSEATTTFFNGTGTMVTVMLPVLLGTSIFGACFTATGGADVVANFLASVFGVKRVIPCCVLLALVLAYCNMGYAGYIITMSIGVSFCKKGNIPARILPGCIFLGAWTMALGGPFAPSPINLVPGQYFGTSPYASWIPGLAGYGFAFIVGIIYLNWQVKKWMKAGEGFTGAAPKFLSGDTSQEFVKPSIGSLLLTLFPIVLMLVLLNAFSIHVFWSACISTVVLILMNIKKYSLKEWFNEMGKGALSIAIPVASFAIIGGFGKLSQSTALYTYLVENLNTIDMNPYVLAVVSTNLLAGIFGSGSTAVALGLSSLSEMFIEAGAHGYNLGGIGRLISMSATGMDSIPSSGSVYAAFNVLECSYKDSYFPVFICSVLLTIGGTVLVALPLVMMGL